MNEIKKKLKLLREQEINEIKNETNRKLNILDDEINDILEKLDVDLRTLRLKCNFFWKTVWIKFYWKGKRIKNISKKKKKTKQKD